MLGIECALDLPEDHLGDVFVDRSHITRLEAERRLLLDEPRADVRRHDEDSVLEVHPVPQPVGQVAVLEHLHEQNGCRALFATHYHEMTRLSEQLPRLKNVSMKVQEWKGEIVFLHEVASGPADRSYGVAVAKLAGLPAKAVKRAEQVLKLLEEGRSQAGNPAALLQDLPLFANPEATGQADDQSELLEMLKNTDPDSMSPRQALDALYQLKELLHQNE